MLTVFVDMMGFLIVLPLLPFYAEKLGANPFAVGALVSSFALAQVAMAPVWGRLSDRYGRRPMILGGLLLSAVAYVVFESAGTVWLLFLSRLVQGGGAGTVGVVQAYVSDSVPRADRAKALGWLTAATSAGVMVGPAIGSLAAGGPLGPGYVAASLCLLNFLFGLTWLPESVEKKSREQRSRTPRGSTRQAVLEVLRQPLGAVGSIVWVYALGMMAFMAMNGVLALYLERRFGVTEATIGWFYVYVGGISLIMRSVVLGVVVRRYGEVATLRLGTLSMAAGLALVPVARTLPEFGLAILLMPVGTALLFPSTTSQLSRRAAEGQTGLLLGVQQSFGGVARMLGPLWAGAAFQHVGVRAPFFLAAGLMLAVRLLAQRVDEARDEHQAVPEVQSAVPAEPS
jgi:predicted MFS family arabinose efflux permease